MLIRVSSDFLSGQASLVILPDLSQDAYCANTKFAVGENTRRSAGSELLKPAYLAPSIIPWLKVTEITLFPHPDV